MNKSEIVLKLKQFFEEEFPNPGQDLTESTDLLENWLVDSFGIVHATLFLEKQFSIKISRRDINAFNFQTLDSLSNFVANQLNSDLD